MTTTFLSSRKLSVLTGKGLCRVVLCCSLARTLYKVYSVAINIHCRDLVDFCEDVYTWMEGHKENVIVVHCKGGKGESGRSVLTKAWQAELWAPQFLSIASVILLRCLLQTLAVLINI